ncbi:hypothetical protein HK096_010491 [Nowakowskiella sp. JEL0078]|nr:hypothetical protein HK096_010491 [Nowakowskiella sp. JEL0078]
MPVMSSLPARIFSEITYSIQTKNQLRFIIHDCPSESQLLMYVHELQLRGVTDIIRACEPNYNTAIFEKSGIRVHDFYFQDGKVPSTKIIHQLLELVDDRFELSVKNRRSTNSNGTNESVGSDETEILSCGAIAVHCIAGLGRAPLLVAIALIENGMSVIDAIQLIRSRRRGAFNSAQLSWLEQYRPGKISFDKKSSKFMIWRRKSWEDKKFLNNLVVVLTLCNHSVFDKFIFFMDFLQKLWATTPSTPPLKPEEKGLNSKNAMQEQVSLDSSLITAQSIVDSGEKPQNIIRQYRRQIVGGVSFLAFLSFAYTIRNQMTGRTRLPLDNFFKDPNVALSQPKVAAYLFAGRAFTSATALVASAAVAATMGIASYLDVGTMKEFSEKLEIKVNKAFPQLKGEYTEAEALGTVDSDAIEFLKELSSALKTDREDEESGVVAGGNLYKTINREIRRELGPLAPKPIPRRVSEA